VIDEYLERGPMLSPRQRQYLRLLRETALYLYEVEDISPPFFADGPSGDLVAASFNLQFAVAAMSGIVEMYVQKVHSLNSQFREQNAAIRESAGG
jgi:hypothetical protein